MRRSTSTVRRACAVGTTIALVGLSTGLGIMTATSASAAEAGSAAVTDGATTAPTSSSTGTSTADAPGAAASTPKTAGAATSGAATPGAESPAAATPTDVPAAPGTDAPAAGEPAAPTTTAPAKPSVGDAIRGAADAAKNAAQDAAQDAPISATAVGQTVEIVGDVSYAGVLNADVDFTGGTYVWTDERGNVLSTDPFYEIGIEAAGQHITVTVTAPDGTVARGTTEDAVPPVFVDPEGYEHEDGDSTTVDAVAGEPFSATFRAESTPAATYSIEYLSSDDDDATPVLPEGLRFDGRTGTLSGTVTATDGYFEFLVTAKAGDATSTLYVDLNVEAAAPVGILVAAIDASDLDDTSLESKTWLITPDGTVSTGTLLDDQSDYTPGGRVTVQQGGSLVVYGLTVDRFGNLVMPDFDEETGDLTFPRTTVTSDVASDVIEELAQEGGPSIAQVTFPHASTHTLTVSSAGVPSTSFAVEVVPTAAAAPTTPAALAPADPVAAAAPVRQTGRLAYTGADESAPIAWALGLLVAGAGLVGARALRRRRAQR